MRTMLLNIIMLISLASLGQHRVYLTHTEYTVTDTFTVNAHRFYFMEYDGKLYLRIKPFYPTNRFVGIVGDGANGKKYRAEFIMNYPDGWEILQLFPEDSLTVQSTIKLTIFSERGPSIVALPLRTQHDLRIQLQNLYKIGRGN